MTNNDKKGPDILGWIAFLLVYVGLPLAVSALIGWDTCIRNGTC